MKTIIIDDINSSQAALEGLSGDCKVRFEHCGLINEDVLSEVAQKCFGVTVFGNSQIENLDALNAANLKELSISSYSQTSFNGALDGELLNSLERLNFDSACAKNIQNHESFTSLKKLAFQNSNFADDYVFSKLSFIESLSLESCKLSEGDILGGNSLELLYLNGLNVANLGMINSESPLRFLSIARLRGLLDIGHITNMLSIEHLDIHMIPHLPSLICLKSLKRLKVLQLVDNGNIDSLKFLAECKLLERFLYIGNKAKVEDGDMSWLKELPNLKYVKFNNRRGYSHKSEEFPK